MPPTVQNTWFFFGAAVVGVVSAATLFIAEHFRQERRRHAMQRDLARLDRQVSGMRKELEQLQELQKAATSKTRRHKRLASKNVSTLSTTSDDYTSALEIDSSDMEFYDLSDEETLRPAQTVTVLENKLKEIDSILDGGNGSTLEDALEQLQQLLLEQPEEANILWRIGKCHHKLAKRCKDSKEREAGINKGIEACTRALDINSNLAESHKWFAILIGSRGEFQPIKNRILDGHTFKKHVDIAISLKPNDAALHHMLGRFAFEVASLKWYERKAASALFSEPPSATYDDALRHLLESEKLCKENWKENKLILAKCYINLGDYKEAMFWLTKADDSTADEGESIDAEIKELMEKYSNYR